MKTKKKDPFISLLSHEIRTPLTAIYGYVQMLNRGADNLTDSQKRWIQSLHFETSRMSSMIEEVLQLYQIEQNTFQIYKTKTSLDELINNSIKRFKALYPDYNLKVTNKLVEDSIKADSLKLTQVITNLLGNAARFSPDNKSINLNVSEDKKNIFLEITDKGSGMTIGKNKGLMKEASSGMSLFLAENIISAHSGKITIKSKEGSGTTITISLPKDVTP